jgi:hypothetical protein
MRPDYLLVGTTKGGTSTLDLWLRQHPEIGGPKRKELHFFCECRNPDLAYTGDIAAYLAEFPSTRLAGEASPCYLYYPSTPGRVAEVADPLILVSLRDPVERIWSHLLMNEIYHPTGRRPDEIIEANIAQPRTALDATTDLVGVSRYGEQLERWFDVFGHNRVQVLFLEEMSVDPRRTLDLILGTLQLEPFEFDTSVKDKQYVAPRGPLGRLLLGNPTMRQIGNRLLSSQLRRRLKTGMLGDPGGKPHLPPVLRSRLESMLREDSRHLESILDRPLPWDWHH